jgi:glycosyltransferase involved in cell wall biosynthesis/O-antigen/teichoic acid export membrane protein
MPESRAPLHILILADRDWTHPQAGGTGTNLTGYLGHWLAAGHRVTVLTSGYPGAARTEEQGRLTVIRRGRLRTAVPQLAFRQWRGLVPDADVVLEVVNGIVFFTPLWLRTPHVTLVHHPSSPAQYELEFGRKGRLAAFVLESAPLRHLYRGSRFLTLSEAGASELVHLGVPSENVTLTAVGVDIDAYTPGRRAPEPTLLYLGRLKRYKRIELLLDVMEGAPDAVLDVAGTGDHRAALEREIERRGLGARVRLHGFVTEERKAELLARAWVNVTASAAEGWGLTVMEAAASRTPSAALAVGGLSEAIVHERTGLLARDSEELGAHVRRLLADEELRERMGTAALERAAEFTWSRSAGRALEVLADEATRPPAIASPLRAIASSDSVRAAGLAAAAMGANVIALLFTVVFARVLGSDGYGSLVALIAAFLVLAVPGQALQVAVAREVSREVDGHDPSLAANVRGWTRTLVLATLAAALVGALARAPLADLIGVDLEWAAAATPGMGCAWLLLCIQRGVLQGIGKYLVVGSSIVGEATARLAFALLLVAAGLGPTGAYIGTALSVAATALVLAVPLHRRLVALGAGAGGRDRPLRDLVRGALVPLLALGLFALLQNIDVIVVRNLATDAAASDYAAVSVAAKALIWVAIGLGLFLLPEATRRTASGSDGRPVFLRTLALVALVGLPAVAVYAVAGHLVLRVAFGDDLADASGALPWLALAMTLLAAVYLSVQFMLALERVSFLLLLAAAAIAEPVVLVAVGADLTGIAMSVLAIEIVLAGGAVALALRTGARGLQGPLAEATLRE